MGAVDGELKLAQSQSLSQVKLKQKPKARKKPKPAEDASMERAGRTGNALAAEGSPEAAERHKKLVDQVHTTESKKSVLDGVKADAEKKREESRSLTRGYKRTLSGLPTLGTHVLMISAPEPKLSTFDKWDTSTRADELVEWLNTHTIGAQIATNLVKYGDRVKQAEKESAEADVKVRQASQDYGAERIKLQSMVRESDLFVRLHAPKGSAAHKALSRKKGGEEPKAPVATTSGPVPGAPVASTPGAPVASIALTPAVTPAAQAANDQASVTEVKIVG